MKYRPALMSLCGLASSLLLTSCGENVPEAKEVTRPAKYFTIEETVQSATRTYPGKASATQSVNLAFRINGPLIKLPAKAGLKVNAGDLLAEIDPRDFNTQLKVAEAALAENEARLLDARLTVGRNEELIKQNAVARAELDSSKALVASLEATKENLLAQKKSAQDSLKDTKLLAPFAGVVADTFVDNFQDVKAKEAILLLHDISKIDIEVQVPESLMIYHRDDKGKDAKTLVTFSSLPGREFPVTLKEYSTEPDPDTNTYKVTLTMDAPSDFELKAGMTCQVKHTSALYIKNQGMLIPTTAMFTDAEGQASVWVINTDNRLEKATIEVGQMYNAGIEVKSGLKPGMNILEAGVHQAYDNMPVKQLD